MIFVTLWSLALVFKVPVRTVYFVCDILWTDWQAFIKLGGIHHWDKLYSWLDFGDLDLIFKVFLWGKWCQIYIRIWCGDLFVFFVCLFFFFRKKQTNWKTEKKNNICFFLFFFFFFFFLRKKRLDWYVNCFAWQVIKLNIKHCFLRKTKQKKTKKQKTKKKTVMSSGPPVFKGHLFFHWLDIL